MLRLRFDVVDLSRTRRPVRTRLKRRGTLRQRSRKNKMRFSAFFSVLRSVGPVVIGISLGFTLSLLSVNWTEEACYLDAKQGEDVTSGHDGQLKGARKPNSISNINDVESEEDFEPRIVPYKQVQQSPTKKVFR